MAIGAFDYICTAHIPEIPFVPLLQNIEFLPYRMMRAKEVEAPESSLLGAGV
jgi:hypothetical protein